MGRRDPKSVKGVLYGSVGPPNWPWKGTSSAARRLTLTLWAKVATGLPVLGRKRTVAGVARSFGPYRRCALLAGLGRPTGCRRPAGRLCWGGPLRWFARRPPRSSGASYPSRGLSDHQPPCRGLAVFRSHRSGSAPSSSPRPWGRGCAVALRVARA